PICLLPWLLFALHASLRRRNLFAPALIAIVSCFALTSGNPDMGGQVLLIGALYGAWCLFEAHRRKRLWPGRVPHAIMAVIVVLVGIAMASDFLFPYLEHAKSGGRMSDRSAGREERPPVGLSALPQVIVPDIYGAYGTV